MSNKSKNFVSRTQCPVCAQASFSVLCNISYGEPALREYLAREYSAIGVIEWDWLVGARYILCECEECQAIFQRDIPNPCFMNDIYRTWIDPRASYEKSNRRFDLSVSSSYASEIMQILAFLSRPPSEIKVLDFGIGWGKWARIIKGFGCQTYGVEIENARRANASNFGIEIIDDLDNSDHRFDFINCDQVFEHLPAPLETLKTLARLLNKDGIIKISVPTVLGIRRRLRAMDWAAKKGARQSLNFVAPLEHINYFRKVSLQRIALRAGLGEVFIPLGTQYAYTVGWDSRFTKNLLTPLVKNVIRTHNYGFFRVL